MSSPEKTRVLRELQDIVEELDTSSFGTPSAQRLRRLALSPGNVVDYASLKFAKRIGEGAFALIDLYAVNDRAPGTLSLPRTSTLPVLPTSSSLPGALDGPAARAPGLISAISCDSPHAPRGYVALKHARRFEVLALNNLAPGERTKVRLPDAEAINIIAEGLLLRQLSHPNIVRVLGFSTFVDPSSKEDTFAIVQEFVPGGTLLARITAGGYTTANALTWLVDIARAVRYLHHELDVSIAHRDLKPENVLLTADGHCKLADFGLFRFMASAQAAAVKGRSPPPSLGGRRTLRGASTTGQTGSQRYMAPENWRHDPYSSKVDVFSFAVLAWEVFASKRAYQPLYLTAEQIAHGVATRGLRPDLPPSWPANLKGLMSSMWSDSPAERPDFVEITEQLEMMHDQYGSEGSPSLNARKSRRNSLVTAASNASPSKGKGAASQSPSSFSTASEPSVCCTIS